ncbi:hypothetical protein [Tenacibaculum finnmarkense]|uniref:hypothetical protein n=1 Tax=Tenacibaculum finnmarkense TaxID=2781243 RepID=UPI001EFAA655|nr:hypothetical protein [Tenacibaculum finnmarkense]MCG8236936.1 hypothetical protein [Tenacibaculum finnmarkense genomovar ulcerans]MCG8749736.1 hypothetical protein [Tenacibaculum finnmarkense]MCG8754853.1 hypothetical protein [Tenacibaculum finnmarkense]MCG8783763.1 hypothetical protein [Tenacibaculum finnmarkense]MCG8831032.1 hypothetical protein [Tenacibaculum finnmarkense]
MYSKKLKFFIFILLLSFNSCIYSQEFNYKKVEDIPVFIKGFKERKECRTLLKNTQYTDITDYLPLDYIKDASVDYTKYLQQAIDENLNVIIPNFPILINDKGLSLRDNQKMVFKRKSKLILKSSAKTNYEMLRVNNKTNVYIFSPKLVGDRYEHLNEKGEWGMGISIKSSNNIKIINPQIKKCWGDGIYLGQIGNKINKNISINYGFIDENRRNGISVISVDGLSISNLTIANTNGTNPQAGIDFEPNANNENLNNIKIHNLYTFNNKNVGMLFVLGSLNLKGNMANFYIENFSDSFSKRSIAFHNMKNTNIRGDIFIKKFNSNNCKNPIHVFKNSLPANLKIKIDIGNNKLNATNIQLMNLKLLDN